MTEREWLTCNDPIRLLRRIEGSASARKLRLFACATGRRLWFLLHDERSRTAVEVAERFADGLATPKELDVAAAEADKAAQLAEHAHAAGWNAAQTAAAAANANARAAAERAAIAGADAEQMREVFGNPFSPPPEAPPWLAWDGGALEKIARAIYDERRFRDVGVLGDALEEAGCTDQALLEHCWSGARHVRGC